MKVYVSIGEKYLENISSCYSEATQIEAELDDPSVDFSKLQGYKVQSEAGINRLVFDSDLYSDWITLQQAQADASAARQKLQEIIRQQALVSASDTDAVSMSVLYPKWDSHSIPYKTNERVQYNGRLYKILQSHTSQSDWTPDAAVSLFEEVKS